jgi:hypothetical protein
MVHADPGEIRALAAALDFVRRTADPDTAERQLRRLRDTLSAIRLGRTRPRRDDEFIVVQPSEIVLIFDGVVAKILLVGTRGSCPFLLRFGANRHPVTRYVWLRDLPALFSLVISAENCSGPRIYSTAAIVEMARKPVAPGQLTGGMPRRFQLVYTSGTPTPTPKWPPTITKTQP